MWIMGNNIKQMTELIVDETCSIIARKIGHGNFEQKLIDRQSRRLKPQQHPESPKPIDFPGRRTGLGTISQRIVRFFRESSKSSVHSQIIIATIEQPSRASPGAPSFSLLFHALCPATHDKPTRPSCATKLNAEEGVGGECQAINRCNDASGRDGDAD
jgi:hypothetical protein